MMAEVFVADILASMEGLTLGASDASVQARDSEAPPGPPPVPPRPKRNPPGPPARPHGPEPNVRSSTSVRRFLPEERVSLASHRCRRLGDMQQLRPGWPASASASTAAPAASATSADVTPPWRGSEAAAAIADASPPVPAPVRPPSATAEECADRWYEEVIRHSQFLWHQEQMSPKFRIFDPVMFLAWKMS